MKPDNQNADALQFIEVIASIAKKLPPSEVAYWGRSETHLLNRLKRRPTEFLQELESERGCIPQQGQAITDEILESAPFRRKVSISDRSQLRDIYKGTVQTEVMPYLAVCRMSLEEILGIIDDDGMFCTLTLQQIRYLATKQNQRGRKGILSFEGFNYFLIRTNRNRMTLGSLFWIKNDDFPYARNKWDFGLSENVISGRLLLPI